LITFGEDAELHKDDGVFCHGTQGADEPGEVGKEVLLFNRVEQNLGAKSKYAAQICNLLLTPAPYVAFPNKDNMKNNRLSPSQDLSR
jgi:hypothetical protein